MDTVESDVMRDRINNQLLKWLITYGYDGVSLQTLDEINGLYTEAKALFSHGFIERESDPLSNTVTYKLRKAVAQRRLQEIEREEAEKLRCTTVNPNE